MKSRSKILIVILVVMLNNLSLVLAVPPCNVANTCTPPYLCCSALCESRIPTITSPEPVSGAQLAAGTTSVTLKVKIDYKLDSCIGGSRVHEVQFQDATVGGDFDVKCGGGGDNIDIVTISCSVGGLVNGHRYEWIVFAKNGEASYDSSTYSFSIKSSGGGGGTGTGGGTTQGVSCSPAGPVCSQGWAWWCYTDSRGFDKGNHPCSCNITSNQVSSPPSCWTTSPGTGTGGSCTSIGAKCIDGYAYWCYSVGGTPEKGNHACSCENINDPCWTTASGSGSSTCGKLNIDPSTVTPGGGIKFVFTASSGYTNVKINTGDGATPNPNDKPEISGPTGGQWTWTFKGTASSTEKTYQAKFISDQCQSETVGYGVSSGGGGGGTCPSGTTNCAGTCVNLKTDKNNCGGCNNVCSADKTCSNGACTPSGGVGGGTTTSTTLPPKYTLACDKTSVQTGQPLKCTVQNCNGGLWVITNEDKTPLDYLIQSPVVDIPPTEVTIVPTGTDGKIKVLSICFDPSGITEIVKKLIIPVTLSPGGTTTTSTTVPGATTTTSTTLPGATTTTSTTTTPTSTELLCGFDNTLTCQGGENPNQKEVLIDDFTSNTEDWQENMIRGSVSGGEYQGQLTSTFDPYIFKSVSFDASLNHLSLRYKGYQGGPKSIKVYYTDGVDCAVFDEACSQSFSITDSNDYATLSFDITDTEWTDNDGQINKLKIDFESATDVGTILLDNIKISPTGFDTGKKNDGVVIKTNNVLTYSTVKNIDPNKGTVDFWVKPYWNGNDDSSHYFIDVGESKDSNRISIYKNFGNRLVFDLIDGAGNINTVSADVSSWKANVMHNIRTTWRSNEIMLYVDGVLVGSDLSVNVPSSLGNDLFIGSNMDKVSQATAVIDELSITANVVPLQATTTTSSTTTTTLPNQQFDMSDVTCSKEKCNLQITKNLVGVDVIVYVNLIHEPEGIIYYAQFQKLNAGSTGILSIPLANILTCSTGTKLTAIISVYRFDNPLNRIYRLKQEAFTC